jgi:hypothetical protein
MEACCRAITTRVFKDTIPRQLTLEYLKLATNTHSLRVNWEQHQIETRGRWHEELMKKVRGVLKK